MNLSRKKVLVTGAGGFIGSHLVNELIELGNEVTALVHYNSANHWGNLDLLDKSVKSSINVINGNVEDPFCVQKFIQDKEVVFHLAALIGIPYSYIAPFNYIRTNVEGTLNVMEACLKSGVEKVIHTSTSEVYGTAVYSPIDEKHPLQGQSPYSASKIGADKIVESYYCTFNLPVATIRPFNAFGPRQSARAVIPTIISQALTGDTVRLGALTPVRDMNYVKNTVAGFIKIAESPNSVGEVINIGSGKPLTIGEIAQKIFEIMNKKIKIKNDEQRFRPQKSEVFQLICNHHRAKELIGWEEVISFEAGLKETIAWIENNLSLFKMNEYNV
jgi:NAD dependent epimerase/dehydratase